MGWSCQARKACAKIAYVKSQTYVLLCRLVLWVGAVRRGKHYHFTTCAKFVKSRTYVLLCRLVLWVGAVRRGEHGRARAEEGGRAWRLLHHKCRCCWPVPHDRHWRVIRADRLSCLYVFVRVCVCVCVYMHHKCRCCWPVPHDRHWRVIRADRLPCLYVCVCVCVCVCI